MATKVQKVLATKEKEKETKRLAKVKADKATAAKEKRDAKKTPPKSDFHSTVEDLIKFYIIKQNELVIDRLTELSITMNSILDVLQTGNSTTHGNDKDPTLDGDINTFDDDPPEESGDVEFDASYIKQAVRIALAKFGSDKVIKLFKGFEIDRISDLKEESYSKMLAALEAL